MTVRAKAGQGVTLESSEGDYALTVKPRLQLRNTLTLRPEASNSIQVRTVRLSMLGHVLSPEIRYTVQLAFGGNDFEDGSSSPVFDAFVEFAHRRDARLRVGQFFVPFDRARTIREFALQGVDRSPVVQELNLDRDIGLMVFSEDLLGLGGRLTYAAGIFSGEGRNRFSSQTLGLLYVGRLAWRPWGAFDEDSEGDLERHPTPKLMIGSAIAYDHRTDRSKSTTGSIYTLGTIDTFHADADAVFKWRGWFSMVEILYRSTSPNVLLGSDANGQPAEEFTRPAWGYFAQTGYLFWRTMEGWLRWSQLLTSSTSDPQLQAQVQSTGKELAGGINYYLNGHALKLQLDCTHNFGSSFDSGATALRAQLDATF